MVARVALDMKPEKTACEPMRLEAVDQSVGEAGGLKRKKWM